MQDKKFFIGLAFLCCIVMGVIFHFRRDIVVAPIRCDVLEADTTVSIHFYRKTKYLTVNFKEGNQYNPVYSHWDNTMDWGNHYADELGEVSYYRRKDGSVCYIIITNDSGWGIRALVDISKYEWYSEDCKNAKSLYRLKMRELGLSH